MYFSRVSVIIICTLSRRRRRLRNSSPRILLHAAKERFQTSSRRPHEIYHVYRIGFFPISRPLDVVVLNKSATAVQHTWCREPTGGISKSISDNIYIYIRIDNSELVWCVYREPNRIYRNGYFVERMNKYHKSFMS